MLTIKAKIILSYALVAGIILVLFSIFIYGNYRDAELTKIDARLESLAARLSNELEESGDEPSHPGPDIVIARFSKNVPGIRCQLIDRNGTAIVSDSAIAHYQVPTWQQAFHEGRRFDFLTGDKKRYRSIWVPVDIDNQVITVLQIAFPLHEYHESLEQMRALFFTIIPLGLLIMGIAAYFITRLAFSPMSRMVETAKTITVQNLHERLQIPRARDEVRLLGITLNEMIGRIQAGFDSQKQFVADASHEIRTPLTVICSELEYAEQHSSEPAVKESLQASLAEIDRLKKLTGDLLLLAKLDASQLQLNLQVVRLDELLVDSVQLINTMADRKNIQIRINLDEPVEIQADKEKMKSIILNLLENAVKYSGENTIVTASLFTGPHHPGMATVSIADQGHGIPAFALPNIFKRFYRVDPSRSENPGSGLGLAIVERLVALHGGTISVESEVGKGTTFTIEFPINAYSPQKDV